MLQTLVTLVFRCYDRRKSIRPKTLLYPLPSFSLAPLFPSIANEWTYLLGTSEESGFVSRRIEVECVFFFEIYSKFDTDTERIWQEGEFVKYISTVAGSQTADQQV